jgi:hypothetical protein
MLVQLEDDFTHLKFSLSLSQLVSSTTGGAGECRIAALNLASHKPKQVAIGRVLNRALQMAALHIAWK